MQRIPALLVLAFLAAMPGVARSAMSSSTAGVGPHGYDFLVGTWSCKNTMASALSGPGATTLTIERSPSGALAVHVSGAGFDAMGYVVYDAKTKMWWNPSAIANGGYGTESTKQTGKKTTWTGPFVDSTGKTMQQRDTYTWASATSYTDLFQVETGGTWKTEGNTTCTKQ